MKRGIIAVIIVLLIGFGVATYPKLSELLKPSVTGYAPLGGIPTSTDLNVVDGAGNVFYASRFDATSSAFAAYALASVDNEYFAPTPSIAAPGAFLTVTAASLSQWFSLAGAPLAGPFALLGLAPTFISSDVAQDDPGDIISVLGPDPGIAPLAFDIYDCSAVGFPVLAGVCTSQTLGLGIAGLPVGVAAEGLAIGVGTYFIIGSDGIVYSTADVAAPIGAFAPTAGTATILPPFAGLGYNNNLFDPSAFDVVAANVAGDVEFIDTVGGTTNALGNTGVAGLTGVSVVGDPTAADVDADSLDDNAEFFVTTTVGVPDSDADGVLDGFEVLTGTNPLVADSDGDGLLDGAENTNGNAFLRPTDLVDFSHPLDPDTDSDGIPACTDFGEFGFGTDPNVAGDCPPAPAPAPAPRRGGGGTQRESLRNYILDWAPVFPPMVGQTPYTFEITQQVWMKNDLEWPGRRDQVKVIIYENNVLTNSFSVQLNPKPFENTVIPLPNSVELIPGNNYRFVLQTGFSGLIPDAPKKEKVVELPYLPIENFLPPPEPVPEPFPEYPIYPEYPEFPDDIELPITPIIPGQVVPPWVPPLPPKKPVNVLAAAFGPPFFAMYVEPDEPCPICLERGEPEVTTSEVVDPACKPIEKVIDPGLIELYACKIDSLYSASTDEGCEGGTKLDVQTSVSPAHLLGYVLPADEADISDVAKERIVYTPLYRCKVSYNYPDHNRAFLKKDYGPGSSRYSWLFSTDPDCKERIENEGIKDGLVSSEKIANVPLTFKGSHIYRTRIFKTGQCANLGEYVGKTWKKQEGYWLTKEYRFCSPELAPMKPYRYDVKMPDVSLLEFDKLHELIPQEGELCGVDGSCDMFGRCVTTDVKEICVPMGIDSLDLSGEHKCCLVMKDDSGEFVPTGEFESDSPCCSVDGVPVPEEENGCCALPEIPVVVSTPPPSIFVPSASFVDLMDALMGSGITASAVDDIPVSLLPGAPVPPVVTAPVDAFAPGVIILPAADEPAGLGVGVPGTILDHAIAESGLGNVCCEPDEPIPITSNPCCDGFGHFMPDVPVPCGNGRCREVSSANVCVQDFCLCKDSGAVPADESFYLSTFGYPLASPPSPACMITFNPFTDLFPPPGSELGCPPSMRPPDCSLGMTRPCGSDVGECSSGVESCTPLGIWGLCDSVGPDTEICNGLDDDCDGESDESPLICDCVEGTTAVCGPDMSTLSAPCSAGVSTCVGGTMSSCVGAVYPGVEVLEPTFDITGLPGVCLDGVDNDCDGLVDCSEPGCYSCDFCPAGVEVCDSVDNDCDGIIDEGCACLDEDGDGVSVCDGDCDDSDMFVFPGAAELCNSIDDDCDGEIDEGCGVTTVPVDPVESERLPLIFSRPGVTFSAGYSAFDGCVYGSGMTPPRVSYARGFGFNVPEGYQLLVDPIKIGCDQQRVDVSVGIPPAKDVHTVICENDVCYEVSNSVNDQLICAGTPVDNIFNGGRRYFEVPFMLEEKKVLSHDSIELEKDGDIIAGVSFGNVGELDVSLQTPFNPVPDPFGLTFGNYPVIVQVNNPVESMPVTITFSTPFDPNLDVSSLKIYYNERGYWKVIGGSMDPVTSRFSISLDLADYLDRNNEALFALFGLSCSACAELELSKQKSTSENYDVVLVVGFNSDKKKWRPFIDEASGNVWIVEYPSSLDLETLSSQLADRLSAADGYLRDTIIIGHSLGGLISQKALQKLYERDADVLNKVHSIVLVGTPNLGTPLAGYASELSDAMLRVSSGALLNIDSPIMADLANGIDVDPVPGVNYYALTGSKPLFETLSKFVFGTEPNDGIVSLESASTIGNTMLSETCNDLVALYEDHLNIKNANEGRRALSFLINKGIGADIINKLYGGFTVDPCNGEPVAYVYGKLLPEESAPFPPPCGCGNGICGFDEDHVSCPRDCPVKKEFNVCGFLAVSIIVFLLLSWLLYTYAYRHPFSRPKNFHYVVYLSGIITLLLLIIRFFLC